ncbi:Transmembrane protein 87B [Geodia barretti]|uniref:Transmembrane protein 87B n=1 Tax=Geodia barretti TaxID=519541 RepID=A0AA35WIT6_GEOBA|nr:Transmembrane protein 87B [Geodia barretti]
MVIWRPSANRNRFAYSLVHDLDQGDEEEEERMENKNFETVKMRSVSRGDAGTPPPISSTQAEDDLRWGGRKPFLQLPWTNDVFILSTVHTKGDAHLLVYQIKESSSTSDYSSPYEAKLTKTLKKFTAKPVTQWQ